MAPLLYIPNFGLRSHPTSGFGFATSRTDGRNLFLGHHHHSTIAGCDDVLTPQRQKQLFWRALRGCYCTMLIPEQHKKKHHSGRKRVNFNVNLGSTLFFAGFGVNHGVTEDERPVWRTPSEGVVLI